MKPMPLIAACGAFLLAACNTPGGGSSDMEASGGATGDLGTDYCETVPTDATEMERWNNLCMPDR